MFVAFIYGPAAAGKHTIGSILSAKTGLPLFHNHLTVDLAATLFEFGTPGFRRVRSEVWRCMFREAAAAGKSFIFTFNPEATVEPELIGELSSVVQHEGGSMFFVELQCSQEGVLQRLELESRKRFGKLTDPELYKTILADGGFDYPGMPEADLRLDTEAMSPEEAATVIAAALQERHLV